MVFNHTKAIYMPYFMVKPLRTKGDLAPNAVPASFGSFPDLHTIMHGCILPSREDRSAAGARFPMKP